MRPLPALLAALGLALTAAMAHAAPLKEWYQYYEEGVDQLNKNQHAQAIKSFEEAVRLKPRSELNARPYGLIFYDYLPYYQQGRAYLARGDHANAVRLFAEEERYGAIKSKGALYKDLLTLKLEAETELRNSQSRQLAQRAREEARSLIREAEVLEKAHKLDDALAKLAGAQALARDLEPAMQQTIDEMGRRIRNERKAREDATAAAQKLDQALAEGARLLEQGKDAAAIVQFDQVLATDRANTRALEGKREAQERIRASETREKLGALYLEGKAHFEAGRYQEAELRLTAAAADPTNLQARALLEKTKAILKGTAQQRELRLKVDRLLEEGEQLLRARKFAEAHVRFASILELDKENVKAGERLALTDRLFGEAWTEKYIRNTPPTLIFFQPRVTQAEEVTTTSVDEPTFALQGYAVDDRGVAKIEFLVGGKVVASQVATSDPASLDAVRNVPFERQIPLEKGLNEITVVATDARGDTSPQAVFQITRRPRITETRAFLPSALAGALGLLGLGLGVQRMRRRRAIRSRFNPYIAGAPVLDDDMFFGRQKLMARMLNVLHHNSLMITGERRIGKTTFLYHLKKALEGDAGTEYEFFPVFTDLQGVPESSFFQTVVADVVDALKLSPPTLAALRFKPELERYDGRDFSHDLQRIIEELKTRTGRKVKLALLIDEVDVLNEYSERVNQRLRSIFMKTFSEHLVAIMSGVGVKRTWKSEGSPWYNFFDEVELKAFSREEAEALIRRPVEGIFRFELDAVEAILADSELKPFFIQKLCIHAVNRMLEEGRSSVRLEDVQAVRDAVLSEAREEEPPSVRVRQSVSA
jgi:AAA ATPase domain